MKNTLCKSAEMADISWTFDDMGVLTVSGNGRMPDYACGRNPAAPWDDRREAVLSLVIGDGITEIGINAFRDCRNLKSVKLPQTVRRIRGYAFRDCIRLETVESDRSVWRYICDERQTAEEDTIIFGMESFLNCPWAITKWNNFYIREGALYVCFSGSGKMEIPEGIHTLKQFSAADLAADEIICPSTLESIEAFAFSGTVVRKGIRLPEEMESIDAYALADCSFGSLRLPAGYTPSGMKKKRMYLHGTEELIHMQRVPKFMGKYYLGTEKVKGSDKFHRVRIMERKPVFHKDGSITAVWDSDYINVGMSVLKKIQRGSAFVCIRHEYGRVIHVKVVAMQHVRKSGGEIAEKGLPCVYLMYPGQDGSKILPWRDSCTYFEPFEIRAGFPDCDGAALAENRELRFLHPDTHEEWFWCSLDEDDNGWQGMAYDALRLWLAAHPKMQVDSREDNIENDALRWFVSV